MSYLGKEPSPVPLTSDDIADGVISTADLADGAVTNAKVNASAAIDISKIAGLDTYTGALAASNLTLSGYLRGPASFTIDPAAHGDNTGTLIVAGNLQVDGTTTTINSTTMTVDDLNMTLASGAADASAANGAGITIDGASASLTYGNTNDDFTFNKKLSSTAAMTVRGDSAAGKITLNCELNTHGVTIQGPPHSAGATYTLTLPNTDGSAGQVLKTDGSGSLDWVDKPSLDTTQTFTAEQSFSGNISITSTASINEVIEKCSISSTTTGTLNFDALTQAVLFLDTNQTANRTINFRGDSSNSLNSMMNIGESMTFAVLATQGSTAYYFNAVQIDASSVTPKWQGGAAPTEGNATGIDSYTFSIIKTASATFTVLASQTQFA